METPTAAGRQSSRKILLRTVALLSIAGAGTAPAAPCAAANCDIAAQDLQGAGIPLSELTVRRVDLGDTGMADEPAVSSGATESMAPLLFLAPRVTSILEDVFEAGEMAEAASEDAAETEAAVEDAPEALLRSPVAETDSASIDRSPSPEMDHASILPKYQRQMYRTDI